MERERPLATIIVLGWNGQEYLDACLSSVLDQELPRTEYEVLYVDNGSTDGSVEFVRERFPEVRVLALDRNYGYAEGNNIGFRASRGQYIVFLNQDTVVHHAWLRSLIDGVQSEPGAVAAHANVIQPWYPEFAQMERRAPVGAAYTSDVNRLGYVHYSKVPSLDRPADTIFLHGVCIAIRRDAVDPLGEVFDPDFFAYAEDLDLGLRVRALGYRSVVVPNAVVYHKHTLATSLSWSTFTKTVRIIRNRYLAFFKVMSLAEFALMLPIMAIGAPLNAWEFGLSPPRQLLYALALVPVTLAAIAAMAIALPRFAGKRRRIRAAAARRKAWCLRAVWGGAGA